MYGMTELGQGPVWATYAFEDFDKRLYDLSVQLAFTQYLCTPPFYIQWYYNDYIYSQIRWVLTVEQNYPRTIYWRYEYECWVVNVPHQKYKRAHFKLRWNGYYLTFVGVPFYILHYQEKVERMLKWYTEVETSVGVLTVVRIIYKSTGILLLPKIVTLSIYAHDAAH
jgi:hypothetical protein